MDLISSLMLLSRDPDLLAWRERGVAIAMTPTQKILRVLVPRPYRWVPVFGDIIAVDWQTGTQRQFYEKYRGAEVAESA